MITFIASYLLWIMFAAAVALWIIDGRKKKELALHAAFSSIFSWIVAEMTKALFPTTRPFLINGEAVKTLTLHFDPSFPSGHSAVAFALAMSIYLHDKKTGRYFLIAAFFVALGRILANVHYPVDVFFGSILGIVISRLLISLHVFKLVEKKG